MKNIVIKNNKSEYYIVSNKDASEGIRFACKELSKYLYLSTSVCIPFISDKCPKYGKEIIYGETRGYKKHDSLVGKSNEAFVIYNDSDNVIISANSDRGYLYATYYLLERVIDFKCFTSYLETYSKKDIIEIEDMEFDFKLEYREVYFTDAFNANFASKNMLNSNLADLSLRYGGKVKWYNFHHSFSDLVNPNEYFDTHPEYFSYIDGKRIKEHTELCLSNEEVLKLATGRVLEWKKNNPECTIFSVAQDEWMGHFIKMACECEKCKKVDDYEGSQSGSIINFVNKVSEEVNKIYPDVLIHTFAYQYSRKAPLHVKPNKNVIVRLCNIECSWSKPIEAYKELVGTESNKFYNDFMNWSNITNRLYIWDYAVNFRNYLLPFPNIRSMVANIEFYKKNNVKGLLMQGNFSLGGKGYLDELKSYLASRYMRYDNLDLYQEIEDFCKAYYGDGYQEVIELINLYEDKVKDYDLWLYDDSDHPMFDDTIINESYKLLNKAIKKSKGECIDRLKELKLSIDYLYITRLDLNDKNRNKLIDEFERNVRSAHISELFERTMLDYSFDVMRKSRYAKDRNDWKSMYYVMK